MKRISCAQRLVSRQQLRLLPFALFVFLCLLGLLAPHVILSSPNAVDESASHTYSLASLSSATGMSAASSPSRGGSPGLDELVFPFVDLCAAAAQQQQDKQPNVGKSKKVVTAALRTDGSEKRRRHRAELATVMDRFDHVPASGGPSGLRWSAATGLPLRADRDGEVKVRFVTSSNRLGAFEQASTTAATMAGVRLTMLGKNWQHFTYMKRMGMMLSYAQLEGLRDSDVIVGMDSDALFSGEDPYSFIEAFVASTAESLAEHRTYSVRDIRFGKRMAPVVFGAEFNCMRKQALRANQTCFDAYATVNAQAAKWAAKNGTTLPTIYTERNPFRLMNTGVFVARVWALRIFDTAAQDFMTQHLPMRTNPDKQWIWMCDQSAMTSLVLDLLLWEFLSGSMDGAPVPLTDAMRGESVYPPMVLPRAGDGPNGVPGGLVGIDASERLSLTVGPELSKLQFYRIGTHIVTDNKDPETQLRKFLATNTKTQMSIMGVPESPHRINIKPRDAVDCADVANVPPECAYRDAVLGIPPGAKAVVPLMWHFAGKRKEQVVLHFRGMFPWYTPTMQNRTALRDVVETLLDAPPTRVYEVDPATDFSDVYHPMKMLPHNASHDLFFLRMCTLAALDDEIASVSK